MRDVTIHATISLIHVPVKQRWRGRTCDSESVLSPIFVVHKSKAALSHCTSSVEIYSSPLIFAPLESTFMLLLGFQPLTCI